MNQTICAVLTSSPSFFFVKFCLFCLCTEKGEGGGRRWEEVGGEGAIQRVSTNTKAATFLYLLYIYICHIFVVVVFFLLLLLLLLLPPLIGSTWLQNDSSFLYLQISFLVFLF